MFDNKIVNVKSSNDAFIKWYNLLTESPYSKEKDTRCGNIYNECVNAMTVIENPRENIINNDIRKMSMKYAIGEMIWYQSKQRNLNSTKLISSKAYDVWDKCSWSYEHEGGKVEKFVNSNYGYCIYQKFGFNQYDFVLDELKNNQSSRRAVVHIKEASDIDEDLKDVNCTIALQYQIAKERLYATTYMRSNDLWLGFPYDVFYFTNIQTQLAMELEVDLGSYTHISGNLHLYEKDVKNNG